MFIFTPHCEIKHKGFFKPAVRKDFYDKGGSEQAGRRIRKSWKKKTDMNIFPRKRWRKLDTLEEVEDGEAMMPSHSHEPGR